MTVDVIGSIVEVVHVWAMATTGETKGGGLENVLVCGKRSVAWRAVKDLTYNQRAQKARRQYRLAT